ncbi:hypothetical protein B0J11DRAFT_541758 [Dendryphion nanum]|uniref:Uncharacterized protein n=1 Tax=Dendryphion nanum TaxID=256645 RepID=A0A9P9D605_9PLEO|nr:hypothetical protein B0J11DRAFT_541758 [Dendryphion nanum]
MKFKSVSIICIFMASSALAVDQEVKSETEVPPNGYVMGGPKSTVGKLAGKVPVAERASNQADTVDVFDDKDFEKALKNPYEILFGRQETGSVWQACVKSNETVITNSTAVNNTRCHQPADKKPSAQ